MSKVLYIKASPRTGRSHSVAVTDAFVEVYSAKNKGDEVLKLLAKISLNNVREHDTITRWGGEEFLILLPQTDLIGARNVAEKIRKTISTYNFNIPSKVTASFGISKLEEEDNEISLIEKADKALYKAKSLGKNRVEVY